MESIFVSNKKLSYFDRFDSTSFYASSSTWPDNGYQYQNDSGWVFATGLVEEYIAFQTSEMAFI
jgi:hypothetical protein